MVNIKKVKKGKIIGEGKLPKMDIERIFDFCKKFDISNIENLDAGFLFDVRSGVIHWLDEKTKSICSSIYLDHNKEFFKIELEAWRKKEEKTGEKPEKKEVAPAVSKTKTVVQKKTKVLVGQQKGISIKLSKCCLPTSEDRIKAYITKNHQASIHKASCENLKRFQKKWPQKIIEASWSEK